MYRRPYMSRFFSIFVFLGVSIILSVIPVHQARAFTVTQDVLYGWEGDYNLGPRTTDQNPDMTVALFWNGPSDGTHVTPGQIIDVGFSVVDLACFNHVDNGSIKVYWADASGNYVAPIATLGRNDIN